jgi:hypothetical protein
MQPRTTFLECSPGVMRFVRLRVSHLTACRGAEELTAKPFQFVTRNRGEILFKSHVSSGSLFSKAMLMAVCVTC